MFGKKDVAKPGEEFTMMLGRPGPEKFDASNMVYAGRLGGGRFSILRYYNEFGSGVAGNLYYPESVKKIDNDYISGPAKRTLTRYGVGKVTDESLTLTYLGSETRKVGGGGGD